MKTRGFAIALIVVFVACAVVLGLSGERRGSPRESQTGSSLTAGGVELDLSVAPVKASSGSPVELRLSVKNVGGRKITFEFNSGQKYDFYITDTGNRKVWQWSTGRSFTEAFEYFSLEAGQVRSFAETWNGTDDRRFPVSAGKYVVFAVFRGSWDRVRGPVMVGGIEVGMES